jgi:hypothetical protein
MKLTIARKVLAAYLLMALLIISIGIVTDDGSRFESPLAMARTAADLKEYAKAHPISNYVKQEDLQQH